MVSVSAQVYCFSGGNFSSSAIVRRESYVQAETDRQSSWVWARVWSVECYLKGWEGGVQRCSTRRRCTVGCTDVQNMVTYALWVPWANFSQQGPNTLISFCWDPQTWLLLGEAHMPQSASWAWLLIVDAQRPHWDPLNSLAPSWLGMGEIIFSLPSPLPYGAKMSVSLHGVIIPPLFYMLWALK